jgi:hypothetical protein
MSIVDWVKIVAVPGIHRRSFTHSGAQASRHFFGLGAGPTLEEMQALTSKFIVMHIVLEEGDRP